MVSLLSLVNIHGFFCKMGQEKRKNKNPLWDSPPNMSGQKKPISHSEKKTLLQTKNVQGTHHQPFLCTKFGKKPLKKKAFTTPSIKTKSACCKQNEFPFFWAMSSLERILSPPAFRLDYGDCQNSWRPWSESVEQKERENNLAVETDKTGLSAKQWLFCQPGKKGFPDRISRRERAWSAVQSANQNRMTDPHQSQHPRENNGCVTLWPCHLH